MSSNVSTAGANTMAGTQTKAQKRTRYLVISAMLSAVSIVLMQFDFSVPLMPSFIKMDLSDLPALIGSFSMGPLYGVIIALVKNLLHLLRTSTGGIGELSNFLLSALFVLPAGVIYQKKKTRKRAIIGARQCDYELFYRVSGLHRIHAYGDHHRDVSGDPAFH